MEPITIWEIWDEEKQEYIFNHIENGHIEQPTPTAKFPSQEKAWKGHSWEKEFAHINDKYQIVK